MRGGLWTPNGRIRSQDDPHRCLGSDEQTFRSRKRAGIIDQRHIILAVDDDREIESRLHLAILNRRPARAFEIVVQRASGMERRDEWQHIVFELLDLRMTVAGHRTAL